MLGVSACQQLLAKLLLMCVCACVRALRQESVTHAQALVVAVHALCACVFRNVRACVLAHCCVVARCARSLEGPLAR
jgi:hypothetical protein